jgi:hypothetical protein
MIQSIRIQLMTPLQTLDDRSKKEMVRYLDEFYNGFDKRTSIVYNLLNECKNF